MAYGNDLNDARSLRAVTTALNQQKGDADPSNWIPPNEAAGGNLIRASIIDIAERKQAELVAAGERRALEKIASSEPLEGALASITEVVERVLPAAICCIRLYDPVKRVLKHVTGTSLPREYVALMDNYPAEIRFGSCAAAIALQRQIIVPDISKDALWEHRRDAAAEGRPARLLVDADHRRRRAHARHVRDLPARTGMPSRRDLELVGPHGAARAHRDRAAPLGRRAARERGPLPGPVRQRRRGRIPGDARRLPAVREPGADRDAGLRLARGAARDRLDGQRST